MRSLHSMKVTGNFMEFVVIEFNDLTPLSVNSIKKSLTQTLKLPLFLWGRVLLLPPCR